MMFGRDPSRHYKETAEPGEGEEYELRPDEGPPLYALEADAKVISWRLVSLLGLGLERMHAHALAQRRDVDLEAVRTMIKNGCPPHLVSSIVL